MLAYTVLVLQLTPEMLASVLLLLLTMNRADLAVAGPKCAKILAGIHEPSRIAIDLSDPRNLAWAKQIHKDTEQKYLLTIQQLTPFAREQSALEAAVLSVDQDLRAIRQGMTIEYDFKVERIGMEVDGQFKPFRLRVFGGALRNFSGSVSDLIFMAFHEIGHVLGERRFLNKYGIVELEGEADYMAGRLMRRFFERPQTLQFISFHAPAEIKQKISNRIRAAGLTGRSMKATEATALAAFRVFSRLYPNTPIDVENFDKSEVSETKASENTPQVRFDSVLAGALHLERPRSWALPSDYQSQGEAPGEIDASHETLLAK